MSVYVCYFSVCVFDVNYGYNGLCSYLDMSAPLLVYKHVSTFFYGCLIGCLCGGQMYLICFSVLMDDLQVFILHYSC